MLFLADANGQMPELINFGDDGGMVELTYPCQCVAHIEGIDAIEGQPGDIVWIHPCEEHGGESERLAS